MQIVPAFDSGVSQFDKKACSFHFVPFITVEVTVLSSKLMLHRVVAVFFVGN